LLQHRLRHPVSVNDLADHCGLGSAELRYVPPAREMPHSLADIGRARKDLPSISVDLREGLRRTRTTESSVPDDLRDGR
jgi:hypothetical protein